MYMESCSIYILYLLLELSVFEIYLHWCMYQKLIIIIFLLLSSIVRHDLVIEQQVLYFMISSSSALKSLWIVTAAMKLEDDCFLAGKLWQTRQCVKNQRRHFSNKGPYSQGYGLSSSHVQLWELDHKESRCWIIEAFELWCWRLLRVPWTERRSNQSILKEINLEYSLEIVMLKLKLQYFGHVMQIANSLEKTLILGKIEGRRREQRMIWLGGVTEAMDMNLGKLQEMVRDREA